MLLLTFLLVQARSEPRPRYPYLASEINNMTKVDQEIRDKFIQEISGDKQFTAKTAKAMNEIDHVNTERMKWIVLKFGWPTPAMVGVESCSNAWLLVQHADADHRFQKQCLKLIEPLARNHVIEGRFYAYLYDRVAQGENRLQRFGTQGKNDAAGQLIISPVEDPKKVDVYRKEFGLTPIEDYAKFLADLYKQKLAPDWRAKLIAPKKSTPKENLPLQR